MKTSGTTLPTFSDNVLHFTLPTRWAELTQKQLRYVFFARALYGDRATEYILCRFLGFVIIRKDTTGWLCSVLTDKGKVMFTLTADMLAEHLEQVDFLLNIPETPVRFESIGTLHAADAMLHGVPFATWLKVENYYQGYLMSGRDEALDGIIRQLYHGDKEEANCFTPAQRLMVFAWVAALKECFTRQFPDLYAPATGDGGEAPDVMAAMNAQIRALTGGDITKEQQVLEIDTWRALTELNEKAREAKELRKQLNKK